ncbi:hypothetical protein Prudu_016250, partial [Prunus dulcis]
YPRPRPSSLPDVAPATLLGADLRDRCQTNQHTTADIARPTSAAAVVGIDRNPPLKPTVQFELSVQISPPFLHQIDRASEVQPTSRRNLQRVNLARTICVEVRDPPPGHHSSVLQSSKKGKKVFCARPSPGVGHAQDLARIPKWKLGRVLSADVKFDVSWVRNDVSILKSFRVHLVHLPNLDWLG